MAVPQRARVLRQGAGAGRVTTVELFFDLVYVFAVTQLSHTLIEHLDGEGVFRTAILLAVVWQIWIYTTWATTYVDPTRLPVRAMLLVLMLGSLVLATALPGAFEDRGTTVAVTYAVMQIGRSLLLVWLLRGEALRATFVRITVWCTASSAVMILGALAEGHGREALWLLAIAIDVLGAAVGFRVPGIGASDTHDWTIQGGHFAERVQAFVLIALGESVVVTGSTFAALAEPTTAEVVAFAAAFAGSVGFWWVYFDRAADDSTERIENSDDPGRMARSAFHWVHPLVVAGIVVSAAADEQLLHHPTSGHAGMTTAWLILGSTALFLVGHALFKAVVWRVASWPRLGVAAALLALLPLGPHTSPLTLGLCALGGLVVVGVCDRLLLRSAAPALLAE
ncbi:Low temperature requirement protein LtrA [Jatrophihabitans endophyticus]|uniref:Low temperature requirement protein LtrA n=1 Tax=Jatrophihabitans endophyticus TaxID=1206085 RepID=A0A1M5GGU7_9ACTN|nr:low temperature requirement protein A [Jatrophihabitans endophyticus]SHG03010.1 Low temperature requirement protein LtrA [Jatrophihabitans endophyticus]